MAATMAMLLNEVDASDQRWVVESGHMHKIRTPCTEAYVKGGSAITFHESSRTDCDKADCRVRSVEYRREATLIMVQKRSGHRS